MLDGTPGAINKAFSEDFEIVTRDEPPPKMRRASPLTTNQTVIGQVFEHKEETVRVYCRHAHDSHRCRRIFLKGAEDTIITLPPHIGEGPWARVVSMEPEVDVVNSALPEWALKKRAFSENQNGIYILKFDYAFDRIQKRQNDSSEFVNIRVDYTNLKDYWSTVTASPPDSGSIINGTNNTSSRLRRTRNASKQQAPQDFHQWKSRVDAAKGGDVIDHDSDTTVESGNVRFKRMVPENPIQPRCAAEDGLDLAPRDDLTKRGWSTFVNWIKKLTTLTSSDGGSLPMGLRRDFTLYSGRLSCVNEAGVTFNAGLDITTQTALTMHTRYSYYFSGSLLPLSVIDAYAFVGVQPEIAASIAIRGDADLGYASERRKIIDTITYPGLAIRGLAAVGPSLDLWGQIDGNISVSGSLRVGAKYTFEPIEVYVPNNQETFGKLFDVINDFHSRPSLSHRCRFHD